MLPSEPLAHGPAASPAGHAISWSEPERRTAFVAWLERLQAPQALRLERLRPASADASFRRYFRIDAQSGSRIIMDAPPALEDCRPFVQVAGLMRAAGLNVPAVLDWDQAQGFMLLSDLGPQTMMQAIRPVEPSANLPLYQGAVQALLTWQKASRPQVLPAYDAALLRRELQLFSDWYLARHRGVAVQGQLRETLERMYTLIIERNLAWPAVYVHRDFMPRNLIVAQDSSPDSALGVLDFQDAVYGPITYDIASLLRDAFLSWDEEFVLDVTVRYWQQARQAGLPVGADFAEFYQGVEWMGLQRHLKVAGIFARLTLRDGKPQYLADTPRFIAYIRATCARYGQLKPMLRLLDEVEGRTEVVAYALGRI